MTNDSKKPKHGTSWKRRRVAGAIAGVALMAATGIGVGLSANAGAARLPAPTVTVQVTPVTPALASTGWGG